MQTRPWRILLIVLLCGLGSSLQAQLKLDGLWEGTLTIGGPTSTTGYRMEMYLERKGRSLIQGRSYVHLSPTRIVEMRFSGRMYTDFSIYLDEVEFISEGDDFIPPFLRKYQLQWNRSVGGSTLNGYWQEIRDKEILDQTRQRGQVFLRKVKENKA